MTDLIKPMSPDEIMQQYRDRLAERAKNIQSIVTAAPSNMISTKGRVFTMPDGTTNPGPISAVIVDFRSVNSFFKGAYNPTKPVPPVCWAIGDLDTLAPSTNCPENQNPEGTCAACTKNQFGTHPSGSKGKACKNMYRLALIPSDLETPDTSKLYTLSVSPTGLKLFSAFTRRVQRLLGDDALPIRVVCDISFDPNSNYPTLVFTERGVNQNLGVALQMLDDAAELLNKEPQAHDE